jgi:hypothetical protein
MIDRRELGGAFHLINATNASGPRTAHQANFAD